MRLAIMQPYLFPYIGYYQLIKAADSFIVYDDIEYTKKGWINRNRILMNGKDVLFSLPLKKDSDFLSIRERQLADSYPEFTKKFKRQLVSAYTKSPCFKKVFPIIEFCLEYEHDNLFSFLLNSLKTICSYLEITTPFIISSTVDFDRHLKGEDKVLNINKHLNSKVYINPIGGQTLYSKERFMQDGIELKFIKKGEETYSQGFNSFIPNLSIIDVMMFNEKQHIRDVLLNDYTLI